MYESYKKLRYKSSSTSEYKRKVEERKKSLVDLPIVAKKRGAFKDGAP